MSDRDDIIQIAVMAADDAILVRGPYPTRATETRAAVAAAVDCLLANGLIEVKPRSEWPDSYVVTPPWTVA